MNRVRSSITDPTVEEQQEDVDDDDDTFLTDLTLNDHQAQIRRRAPTRHSIKSLTGRKTLSKQNSTNEVIVYISARIAKQSDACLIYAAFRCSSLSSWIASTCARASTSYRRERSTYDHPGHFHSFTSSNSETEQISPSYSFSHFPSLRCARHQPDILLSVSLSLACALVDRSLHDTRLTLRSRTNDEPVKRCVPSFTCASDRPINQRSCSNPNIRVKPNCVCRTRPNHSIPFRASHKSLRYPKSPRTASCPCSVSTNMTFPSRCRSLTNYCRFLTARIIPLAINR